MDRMEEYVHRLEQEDQMAVLEEFQAWVRTVQEAP
jgi:hypothetical protein